ncbi:MAG: molecular chaperone DnaK [Tepidisphaeraceae bacterium]|jgi:molecular chaperone DnaK
MGPIIGIDLGTTNSVAAYMKDGHPEVIPNLEGDPLTPSVVAFARDNRRWVGRVAKAQAVANPLRTVFSAKRHMGRAYSHRPVLQAVVSSIKRQMGSDYLVKVDGRAYTAVEISAMILEKVKADAETYLRESIHRAVITVPAYFSDSQRRATRDAASLAGLEVVRLVNEPTAAALAYGLDIEKAHTILVWDLGGGTFDVSILELGDGVFEVKAVNGDTQLGGDDYDQCLAEFLVQSFREQWHIDLGDDPAVQRLLRQLAEEAKISLSADLEARIVLPPMCGRGNRCAVSISRDAFEHITAHITEKMAVFAQRVISDAGIDPADLDRVILVGGMTRVPAVRKLVREITGLEPYVHVDPDKVVAMGAAIQAGVLAGQVRKVTLVDVTPLSLGIETQGGLFSRIIQRNSPVPATKSRLFTNARDNQTSMEVHVLQGERELATDNMTLGRFELAGITPQPRGEAKVEVAFDIDANGMIHVSATDLQTDAHQRIRVETAGEPSREAIDHLMAESRKQMTSDRRKREEIEAAIRAENLLRATEQLVDQASQDASTDAILLAVQAAETGASAVREALAAGEASRIVATSQALEACLKKLHAEIKTAPCAGAYVRAA